MDTQTCLVVSSEDLKALDAIATELRSEITPDRRTELLRALDRITDRYAFVADLHD